ncbi:HNH endonuclease [Cereibacter changlensis]|uniref:HNH endonuclease n=1 Tax=Cereibacter changlensis TaxID=402884 RepID=UPI004033247C
MRPAKSNWSSSKRVKTKEFIRNREIVRSRDKVCIRCFVLHGLYVPGKEVDHWQPQAFGGTDELDNLWMLCSSCHSAKTNYENADRVGFPSQTDHRTGWPVEEPDWQSVIKQRHNDWLSRQGGF